jgi:hypothetical protein
MIEGLGAEGLMVAKARMIGIGDLEGPLDRLR